jgi:hypothetical protein
MLRALRLNCQLLRSVNPTTGVGTVLLLRYLVQWGYWSGYLLLLRYLVQWGYWCGYAFSGILFSEDTGVDTPSQVSCSERIPEWLLLLRYLIQWGYWSGYSFSGILFSEDTGVDTPSQVSCSARILEWILLLRYLVQWGYWSGYPCSGILFKIKIPVILEIDILQADFNCGQLLRSNNKVSFTLFLAISCENGIFYPKK